jgi:soluble lytic murein transglycosylase
MWHRATTALFAASGVLLTCIPHALLAQPDSLAAGREAFRLAYAVAATAPLDAEKTDSEELLSYPAYAYLQAARIQGALGRAASGPDAADGRAAAFIARYEAEPVSRDVRRDLLASLARRKQWAGYLEEYRDDLADPRQRCNSFTARLELQRLDGLREAVIQQWVDAKDTIAECDSAFTWLRAQGGLTPELLEARIRLALQNGNVSLARQLVKELPTPSAAPLRLWISLIEQPAQTIDALIAAPATSVEPEALLDGWSRLARSDAVAALQRLDSLVSARQMTEETASPYALALALSFAWSRDPRALPLFARVQAADVDERAAEWHARAALWNGEWEQVAKVIAAMPEALRSQSRWRYWAARAAEKQHQSEAAKTQYSDLLPTDNYFAALAAARLHQGFAPHPQVLARDAQQVETLAAQPALVRAHELLLCGLEPQAEVEWWEAQAQLDATAKRQSIHLAADWQWFEAAIITAARQSFFEDYTLLFPRPYREEIKAGSKQSGLPEALIYATLRQESLYDSDAVSSADALGLLQLQLGTARKIARQLGRPAPTRADLLNPAINVPLGAAELAALLAKFQGQVPVALAAYNAGPAAAARWLPPSAIDADVWIENIPYNETRTYVQRVQWHSIVFGWLEDARPQATRSLLEKVRP